MLVIKSRLGERIKIGDSIEIHVLPNKGRGRGSVRIGIEAPPSIRVIRSECDDSEFSVPHRGLPRIWALMSIVIPTRVRRTVFQPLFYELVEDYDHEWNGHKSNAARWWIRIVFTIHVTISIADTLRVGLVYYTKRTGIGWWRWMAGATVVWWLRH